MDWLNDVDTSELQGCGVLFKDCVNLTTIPAINITNVTTLYRMFYGCTSLVTIPELDTQNVSYATEFCSGCSALTNVPTFDFSKLCTSTGYQDMRNMFASCPSLSSISLNNILASLNSIVANISANYKKLSYIGLSSTQATTCTTLSNWSALQAKGWTTGY